MSGGGGVDAAEPPGDGGLAATPAPTPTPPAPGECAKLFGSGPASEWVHYDATGRLVYKPINSQGDRIMDFSSAGYMGGGIAIPMATVAETVKPSGGDDTAAIQAAIDAVSKRPLEGGLRGAVLLAPGKYRTTATLTINASGVVLRGSGASADGTDIDLTNTSHLFLRIAGGGTRMTSGPRATITDVYVPAGARAFTLDDAQGFKAGDPVLVGRPVTSSWVKFMGMDYAPEWFPAGFIQYAERVITAVDGNKVTIDVPISDSFDGQYVKPPGATVEHYTFDGRIAQVGLESLRVFAPVRTASVNHQFVEMTNAVDSWVRDVAGHNCVNGIHIEQNSRRITVEDAHLTHDQTEYCSAAAPFDFNINAADVLIQRSSARGSYKAMLFTTHRAMGPNVLLDIQGDGRRSHIQPHMKWATGLLVDGADIQSDGSGTESAIQFMNRGSAGSHHGWAIGWAVAWNCTAPNILLQRPPGSMVWAIGCKAMPSEPMAAPLIESVGTPVAPRSLYLAQLCDRLGPQALVNIMLRH
jgi:hypothetical protein